MGRSQIEKMTFEPKTALISITDAEWEFAKLKNKPDYLLRLAFDDVDADVFEDELGRKPTEEERLRIEEKYNIISDAQAKEIAEFYFEISEKADIIICQCEHGQSRSAAIAAAITEYREKNGITIFASDDYYPNKLVFRKVYNELNCKK